MWFGHCNPPVDILFLHLMVFAVVLTLDSALYCHLAWLVELNQGNTSIVIWHGLYCHFGFK